MSRHWLPLFIPSPLHVKTCELSIRSNQFKTQVLLCTKQLANTIKDYPCLSAWQLNNFCLVCSFRHKIWRCGKAAPNKSEAVFVRANNKAQEDSKVKSNLSLWGDLAKGRNHQRNRYYCLPTQLTLYVCGHQDLIAKNYLARRLHSSCLFNFMPDGLTRR